MSLAAHLPTTRLPAPGRLRAALLVLGCVLLLHTLLLGLVDRAPGRGWASQPARVVSVRQVPRPAPGRVAPSTTTPSTAPAPTPRATPVAATTAHGANADAPPTTTAAAAAAPAEALPTPEPGGLQVPVYRTQLPPTTVLQFESRRGVARGTAELAWQRGDDGYRLSLQGQALGAPFISWASVGAVDAAGLAPLRYTESRRGRELRAANFQRDLGQVSFSGPAMQHPLVAGMQDRLSWLIQLPAILQADPALAQPGEQVHLAVVGTRGDAEVWTFTVQGRAPLDLPGGSVAEAVHLLREPRRPYDTQVQVWLDPARQHLPVQAWLRVRATGEGTELRLLGLATP